MTEKDPEDPNLNIIFFGNTKYSIIGARIIHTVYPIMLFVTIPDSPVEFLAAQLKVPALITSKLDKAILGKIKGLNPDFLIVEDYGLILPKELLDIPKIASLNIHHSLLPKYRGPSPAPFAILNGDAISGVSIIKVAEKVDTGEILAQQSYELRRDETTDSLLTSLNQLGAELLLKVINSYIENSAKPVPQDESRSSYTKRFTRQDGYFDIDNPPTPEVLDRMIRAYYPWPGVWTKWNGRTVKFLPSTVIPAKAGIYTNRSGCPKDTDSIKSGMTTPFLIQMEGKKVMDLKDFLNGYPDFPIKQLPQLAQKK